MKKKIFLLVIILQGSLISAFAQTPAAPPQVAHLAVAFYNMENLFHPSDEPHKNDQAYTPKGAYHYTYQIYSQKLHHLATVVATIGNKQLPDGPALVGLAEIENDSVLFDLVDQPEIRERHYRFIHFDSRDARGMDVALLYHPKYFQLLQAHAKPLYWEKGKKKHYVRDILYAKGLLTGDTVDIFVVHWPSRVEGLHASAFKRLQVAAICRQMINKILEQRPNAKIIVMGDFNDNPTNKSLAQTLQAVDPADTLSPTTLYNPWLSIFKKGMGTTVYHHQWNLFDQILLSSAFVTYRSTGWRYDRVSIFNPPFLVTHFGKYKGYPHRSFSGTRWIDGYSDHFPVVVYLAWYDNTGNSRK